MKRYTDEPRTSEQELLALDSIYKILTIHERILLHLSQNKPMAETTDNIWRLLKWIDDNGWKSPFMKYPEFHKDVLHYEDEFGELQPVKNYPNAHKDITEQLKNFMICTE